MCHFNSPEDKSLRAYAIGPAPDAPLYIFYPAKHPYDQVMVDTIANQSVSTAVFSYMSEQDEFDTFGDDDDDDGEDFKAGAKNKGVLLKKTLEAFGRTRRRSPRSYPRGSVSEASKESYNMPLSQSLLQVRSPLDGNQPKVAAGIRWSSVWLNERLATCALPLDAPAEPPIIPTDEESDAIAARQYQIEEFEKTIDKLKGIKRWWYKMLHEKSVYRELKITGGLTREQRIKVVQPDVLRNSQDAGVMFASPEVVCPQDARVAQYFLPLTLGTTSGTCPSSSGSTTTNGGSKNKTQDSLRFKLATKRSNPILRREGSTLSCHRRNATVMDLQELFKDCGVGIPVPLAHERRDSYIDYSSPSAEYVIANEYTNIETGQVIPPDEELGDNLSVFYEPPVARTKGENRTSDVAYTSGKYMWIFERASWVIIYERRKMTSDEKLEVKRQRAALKKEPKGKQSNGQPSPRNLGRVKVYHSIHVKKKAKC